MRCGRIISAGLLTLVALLATARMSCTFNIGLPPQTPPVVQAPAVGESGKERPLGLPADWFERSREAYKQFPRAFKAAGAAEIEQLRRKKFLLSDAVLLCESANKPKGQHYTSGPQQSTDCVAWSLSTAIYHRLARQVQAGESAAVDDPFPAFNYGMARVTQGGGRPRCGAGGAYPSDAAKGFCTHGWVSYREAGVSYSGRLADQWGCQGPPRALLEIAKTRAGGETHPIRTTDECIEAIAYGFPVTLGMPWGRRRERSANGFTVTEFPTRADEGHALCIVGYDGTAGDGQFVIHNSHGPDAHTPNPGDAPGSFRVTRRMFDDLVEVSELWAYSDVKGFPAKELDLSGLDDLVLFKAAPTGDRPALSQKGVRHAPSKLVLAP